MRCATWCPLSLPFTAFGLTLATTGISQDETQYNPAETKSYLVPAGWQTYSPEGKPAPRNVYLDSVRLLQSQDELASRTSVQALAAFIDLAQKAAEEVFASYGKPTVLLVQFTCVPGKCSPSIGVQGDLPRELLQAYYDKLRQLQALRCSGEIRFQVTLKVRP